MIALPVVVPLLAAAVLLGLGRLLPHRAGDAIAALAAACSAAYAVVVLRRTAHGRVVSWLGGWRPRGGHGVGIPLVGDQISAGVVLLAALLVLAALVYGWRYYESTDAHYHALMLLFLAGMAGFALSGDLFDMFVFFELMGAVAYALTGYKIEDPAAVQGGLNFGVINSLGAYLTLVGIGLLYARTGQLGLAPLGEALRGHGADPLVLAGFVCVVTGFLVKAAMVPFHFWLADAHAVAPAPVCVLFSGLMVELGLYGVVRVYTTVFAGALPEGDVRRTFLVLGVVTAVVGAVMCLAQRNVKRLLAYSTIAHMGLFTMAAFMLTPDGLGGAVTYAAAHAGVKAGLFLTVGIMLNRHGTVDEHDLYGRARGWVVRLPLLAGAAGLAGLPPFGPGLGKALSEDAVVAAGYGWAPIVFVLVSALTAAAVLRAALRVGFGVGPHPSHRRSRGETGGGEEREASLGRVPATMSGAMAVLVAGGMAIGLVPWFARVTGRAADRFLDGREFAAQVLYGAPARTPPIPEAAHWTTPGVAYGLLSAALAVGIALAAIHRRSLPAAVRRAGRTLRPAFGVLRQVHSGHVGDYVAWLLLGVVLLAASLLPAI